MLLVINLVCSRSLLAYTSKRKASVSQPCEMRSTHGACAPDKNLEKSLLPSEITMDTADLRKSTMVCSHLDLSGRVALVAAVDQGEEWSGSTGFLRCPCL